MAAALVTLFQASLLAQDADPGKAATDAKGPKKPKAVPQQLATLSDHAAEVLASSPPTAISPGTAIRPETMTVALQQLVAAAAEVAKVDEMIQHAQEEVPTLGDAEARKWHNVSVQALLWTRAALKERQQKALMDVRSLVLPAGAEEAKSAVESEAKSAVESVVPGCEPWDSKLPEVEAEVPFAAPPGLSLQSCKDAPPLNRLQEPVPLPKVQEQLPPWHRPREPAPEPAAAGPGAVAEEETARSQHAGVGSLRADLEVLRNFPPALCVIVRKIKRLGLDSSTLLEEHFSQFGPLKKVFVAHSFERPSAKRRHGRVRPAALGFLLMDTAEAAQAIMAAGSEHLIRDVEVSVQMFEAFADFSSFQKE